MNLVMAGVDYKTARVEERELFSRTTQAAGELALRLKERTGALGCVVLSTCNRTEVYFSCGEGGALDAAAALCDALELPARRYAHCFTRREQRRAATHLMMVAAGLRSQLRGEDQILAQVKTAIDTAREHGAADAVLETLFRTAVSGGKRTRTEVALSPVDHSVAHRALAVLSGHVELRGKPALVIGNGEMGRLAAGLLVGAGCNVTVTMRSYKRQAVLVPEGCAVIPYELRYQHIPQCQVLVSATTSPHHTVVLERLLEHGRIPPYLVDLAVPRDIEPAVGEVEGVTCWNVDTLGAGALAGESAHKLVQIKAILDHQMERFDKWLTYREQRIGSTLKTG